jgi:PAS domain S-box-containing protein
LSSSDLDWISVLRHNPELQKKFLDIIGDALFVVNTERDIVYWNRRAEELTGYSADEVLGQFCQFGLRCETCANICNLFEQGRIKDSKVTLRAKDGNTLHVTKSAFLLHDDQGQVVGAVELMRDETALTQRIAQCQTQREQIAERERLQSAVLGSISEGVLTLDLQRRITSFSRRAEAITGHTAIEVIGKHCYEVIGSQLCENGCPALRCQQTGQEEVGTTKIENASGKNLSVSESAVLLHSEAQVLLHSEAQVLLHSEVQVLLHSEAQKEIGVLLLLEDRSNWLGWQETPDESVCFEGLIGRSQAMRRVFKVVEQVGRSDVTVLLTGESGTGKEMVSRAIHRLSRRRKNSLLAINCAALPESLLESELFGHVRGAFTGAVRDRPGLFEEAEGGTLFLDEIGEMPLSLQAKLLRVLQEREYQRVGENRVRKSDVRIIAATNRDLTQAVTDGGFREDLYYRIRVIPINIPPLRERREDIPLLATHLLKEIANRRGRPNLSLTPDSIELLRNYHWSGNVRELINALEYAVALSPGRRIGTEDLPPELSNSPIHYPQRQNLRDDEPQKIQAALAMFNHNRTKAAKYLGMHRSTLFRKMRRYNIEM